MSFLLKKVVLFVVVLYSIGFLYMLDTQPKLPAVNSRELLSDFLGFEPPKNISEETDIIHKGPYKFTNPNLAKKILSKLDVYRPLTDERMNQFKQLPLFDKPFLGFKSDDEYCEKHRAYFVEHPESVFNDIHAMLGKFKDHFIPVKVSPGFMKNSHPQDNQKDSPTYDINPEVNSFFTGNPMYPHLHIGKQFSCLSQVSNHIPGSSYLNRKELVAQAASLYVARYKDRPQCLSYDKFFPQTWVLSHKGQCKEFFALLNSEEYQELKQERRLVFMKKLPNTHRGEGVEPVNEAVETALRHEYQNGKLCGELKASLIMQRYIHNPLLIEGRKFDFRMYMLIASVNPLIVYYHDGFLRVSLTSYDENSDDKKALLTNLSLNKQIYNDAAKGDLYEGMDKKDLLNAQQWDFERFQKYLLEEGVINDPDWLNNYLRPEMKKAMMHLNRLSLKSVLENSSVYGLYGIDFMLDTDLNLWFIEANAGPAFGEYTPPVEKIVIKMLRDHYEIVYGLLRSRMKRSLQYVNQLIQEKDGVVETEDGEVMITELDEKIAKFDELNKNYFDEEFEVDPENGFVKIIDANYKGLEMYQGLLKEECL